jgi:methionyl-tRNA synthetase
MKLFKAIGLLSLSLNAVSGFSISSHQSSATPKRYSFSSQPQSKSTQPSHSTQSHYVINTVLSLTSTSTSTSTTEATETILGTPATPFDDGKSPYQITTPIYYVNDKPHIGHAYTSTACDVIARFMRLSGREVFFLSGTDEHGQKVEQSAAKKGMEPQDFVNEISKSFEDLLELMNISNDEFIRTTSEDHKASVQVSEIRLV